MTASYRLSRPRVTLREFRWAVYCVLAVIFISALMSRPRGVGANHGSPRAASIAVPCPLLTRGGRTGEVEGFPPVSGRARGPGANPKRLLQKVRRMTRLVWLGHTGTFCSSLVTKHMHLITPFTDPVNMYELAVHAVASCVSLSRLRRVDACARVLCECVSLRHFGESLLGD